MVTKLIYLLIVNFLLVMCFIFSLTGCSGMPKDQTQTSGIITQTETPPLTEKTPEELPTSTLTNIPFSPTGTATNVPSSTLSPSSTSAIISPTIQISQTSRPTLTKDERNAYLVELLETNGDCELPCFWGIIPGETTWEEANRFLQTMDQEAFEVHQGSNDKYMFEYQNHQDDFTIAIDINVIDKIVDYVYRQIIVYDTSPVLEKFEKQFSLKSLFETYGIPSRIWMILTVGEISNPETTLYTLWLFYDDKGYLILYHDDAKRVDENYQACPNQLFSDTKRPLRVTIMGQKPDNPRPLESVYTTAHGIIPYYFPIDEAAGIEIAELYDHIIQGDVDACFETPRDIWP